MNVRATIDLYKGPGAIERFADYPLKPELSDAGVKSKWLGDGCALAAAFGPVTAAALESLARGSSANAKVKLRRKRGKVVGIEIGISVDKPTSLLAWRDRVVLSALEDAVERSVYHVESMIGWRAPAKHGHSKQHSPTGKGVCAVVRHQKSRKNDPQLHWHIRFPNLTWDATTGKCHAIDTAAIMAAAGQLRAIIECEFRHALHSIGVNSGSEGVVNFPSEMINAVSDRRAQILAAMADKPRDHYWSDGQYFAARDHVAAKTRRAKCLQTVAQFDAETSTKLGIENLQRLDRAVEHCRRHGLPDSAKSSDTASRRMAMVAAVIETLPSAIEHLNLIDVVVAACRASEHSIDPTETIKALRAQKKADPIYWHRTDRSRLLEIIAGCDFANGEMDQAHANVAAACINGKSLEWGYDTKLGCVPEKRATPPPATLSDMLNGIRYCRRSVPIQIHLREASFSEYHKANDAVAELWRERAGAGAPYCGIWMHRAVADEHLAGGMTVRAGTIVHVMEGADGGWTNGSRHVIEEVDGAVSLREIDKSRQRTGEKHVLIDRDLLPAGSRFIVAEPVFRELRVGDFITPLRRHEVLASGRYRHVYPERAYIVERFDQQSVTLQDLGKVSRGALQEWDYGFCARPGVAPRRSVSTSLARCVAQIHKAVASLEKEEPAQAHSAPDQTESVNSDLRMVIPVHDSPSVATNDVPTHPLTPGPLHFETVADPDRATPIKVETPEPSSGISRDVPAEPDASLDTGFSSAMDKFESANPLDRNGIEEPGSREAKVGDTERPAKGDISENPRNAKPMEHVAPMDDAASSREAVQVTLCSAGDPTAPTHDPAPPMDGCVSSEQHGTASYYSIAPTRPIRFARVPFGMLVGQASTLDYWLHFGATSRCAAERSGSCPENRDRTNSATPQAVTSGLEAPSLPAEGNSQHSIEVCFRNDFVDPFAALHQAEEFLKKYRPLAEANNVELTVGDTEGITFRAAMFTVPQDQAAAALRVFVEELCDPDGQCIGRVLSKERPLCPGDVGVGIEPDGTLFVEQWIADDTFMAEGGFDFGAKALDHFMRFVETRRILPEAVSTSLEPTMQTTDSTPDI